MDFVNSDFSALEGTNCYCSEQSAMQIRQAIQSLPLCAVHGIGSGDYHYVSLFWLERISEDFRLILFDNHPDDQECAFSPETLSCGSWIINARALPHLKDITWIQTSKDKLYLDSSLPVYISIDLDILDWEYARTDWDQGLMTLPELIDLLQLIKEKSRIIGVDVCGGLSIEKGASPEDLAINASTEEALKKVFNVRV